MSNAVMPTSVEQARELTGLCRAGKLYDIEKRIAASKSPDISGSIKRGKATTALQIAVAPASTAWLS